MPETPELPNDDPLGLEGVDREIHIEKLRREIDEVAGGEMFSGKTADCDPKIEEAFLENVLALETHGFVSPHDVLIKKTLICRHPTNSMTPRLRQDFGSSSVNSPGAGCFSTTPIT